MKVASVLERQPVYVGIDVAVAKSKRLPIVVARRVHGRLEPLALRAHHIEPPVGPGNAGMLDTKTAIEYANDAAKYLSEIESSFHVTVQRIAIDAPREYCREGAELRDAEADLRDDDLSFFSTPTRNQFESMLDKARQHAAAGGETARLPYANKLWMHAGFQLFHVLGTRWDCIETYPYAISRALGVNCKKTKGGHKTHLRAACVYTRWVLSSEDDLRDISHGSPHDRVDAYLACWVASLTPQQRRSYGKEGDSAIWVPIIPPPSDAPFECR
jgi:predicted nuclease with RNAse H fold